MADKHAKKSHEILKVIPEAVDSENEEEKPAEVGEFDEVDRRSAHAAEDQEGCAALGSVAPGPKLVTIETPSDDQEIQPDNWLTVSLKYAREAHSETKRLLLAFVESKAFGSFILFIILINTCMLIAQTDAHMVVRWGWHISAIDNIFLSIYVMEALLKIVVYKKVYFADGWNVLDFNIVIFSVADFLFPFVIQNVSFNAASIFRVLRIFRAVRALRALRVLRTIRFLNTLQVILLTLFQSIKSIGAIVVLIVLFMCIFSVVGRDLYSKSAPEYFGNLFLAFFTLFQLLTLDDWFLVYQTVIERDPSQVHVFVFLVLYIIVEYFVLLNLFVAVLVDNFQLAMTSQSGPKKKKGQHAEDHIDDEDYYLYKPGSVAKVEEWENTMRKNIASYYPSCGRGEQRVLKDYFHLLTAYEDSCKTLENYEHILASMADICSDTADSEDA